MIVPQTRLLTWVALVVVPFALLAAVVPAAVALSGALMGILVVLALVDAILAYNNLNGIGAELPPLVRLTQQRQGAIEIRIRNDSQQARQVRLGLALPREILSQQEDALVALPAGSQSSRLFWPCTGTRRGSFRLGLCCLESASPLGFWAVRASLPLQTELRVYPNLMGERSDLAALFLNRGNFGLHAQRQVGKGREFEKLREYIAGDSFEDIHWKATAKRGHPVTKVFQIERTQEVYVIIDASRLSARTAEVQS